MCGLCVYFAQRNYSFDIKRMFSNGCLCPRVIITAQHIGLAKLKYSSVPTEAQLDAAPCPRLCVMAGGELFGRD